MLKGVSCWYKSKLFPCPGHRLCHSTAKSERIVFQLAREVPRVQPTTSFVDDDFVYQNIPEQQNALYDTTVVREQLLSSETEVTLLNRPVDKKKPADVVEPFDHRSQGLDTSTDDLSSTPLVQLPFDDAKKAEDVLQMSIEGQIQENWQDKNPAREEDVGVIVECLKKHKAWDIAVINTKTKTHTFDYLIFASCHGTRHINLLSWAVQELDKLARVAKMKRKLQETEWEPIPIGRIVVNLMTEKYRKKANFERKWVLTSSMNPLDFCHHAVSEGRGISSHGIWSLTLNIQDLEDYENDYCREALLRQY